MKLDNLCFAYLARELDSALANAFVSKAQEIGRDCFKFKLHTTSGSKDLLFLKPASYLTKYSVAVSLKPGSFLEKLKKELGNRKIISVKQHNLDRILVIEFVDKKLILEHFADSNLILTDSDWKIIAVLKRQEWKDRKLAVREKYLAPSSAGKNILEISEKEFVEITQKSEKDLVRSIVSLFNASPLAAEEAIFLAKAEKNAPAKLTDEKKLKEIYKNLKNLYSETQKNYKPLIINDNLVPFHLKSLENLKGNEFDSIMNALDESFTQEISPEATAEEHKQKSSAVDALRHSLGEQEKMLARFKQEEDTRKQIADLLKKNYWQADLLSNAAKKSISQKASEQEVNKSVLMAISENSLPKSIFKKIDIKQKKLYLEL